MVFKIKNVRQILIGFLLFAILFFMYSDQIVNMISPLNPLLILLITPLLNPIYVLLIGSLFEQYGFRGIIGGFFVITAVNTISIPHILNLNGTASDAILKFFPDTTLWGWLPEFLKFNVTFPVVGSVNFGVFLVYVVISTALLITSLMIAHKRKFKEIFLKAV